MVTKRECECVVIGGVNVDLLGLPAAPLCVADSNPGHIRRAPGGVGRNISENLALMGVQTCLVSAVGRDAFGDMVLEQTAQSGVDVSATIRSSQFPTALYASIFEHTGELHVAMADMEIMDLVDSDYIESIADLICGARIIVVDCNLSSKTLATVARVAAGRPLFADTVSGGKAARLRPILKWIDTLKPNLLEASLLLPEYDSAAVAAAASTSPALSAKLSPATLTAKLRKLGTGRIFVSMGADGVWYDCGSECGWYGGNGAGAESAATVTGAGDAFMAGLIYARLQGYDPHRSAACGAAAATMALAGEAAINRQLSAGSVEEWVAHEEQRNEQRPK